MTQIEILKAFVHMEIIIDGDQMYEEYPYLYRGWIAVKKRIRELQDEPINNAWLRANGFEVVNSTEFYNWPLLLRKDYDGGGWKAVVCDGDWPEENYVSIRPLTYTHEVIALVEALTGKAWGETK